MANRSGGKPKNKNVERGFVIIRRGIYDHLSNGHMTGLEWMVYSALHLKADYRSGVCLKVSAPALAHLLQLSVRMVNRVLSKLEKKDYIRRLKHRGRVRSYPVVINKYLTSNGLLIDAPKTKSLNEIAYYTEQDCLLTVFQRSFNCPANVLQMSCLQEIENIRLKEVTKKGKTPAKSFTPPTPQEVKEYATSKDFADIDAQYFCDYYAAEDWRSKDGHPLKSWKRAVLTWKNISKTPKGQKQEPIFKARTPTKEDLALLRKD